MKEKELNKLNSEIAILKNAVDSYARIIDMYEKIVDMQSMLINHYKEKEKAQEDWTIHLV